MKMRISREGRRPAWFSLLAPVTAALSALWFTPSVVFDSPSALAQSKGKTDKGFAGTVDGKLTIDGKATQLKYVYARRDSSASPLVDLIVTNQPLSDEAIADILAVKYHGPDKLRGMWLMLDSKGAYKPPQLLIGSAEVASTDGAMEMMAGDEFNTIENGRMKGKLECKINTPARTTSFIASFDAPLMVGLSDTAAAAPSSAEQFRKDFERVMRGKWSIEKWRTNSGNSYSGILSVDERLAGGKFRGTFHLVNGKNDTRVDEHVTISREGTKVRMEGHLARGTRWSAHTFTFELRGDVLVGGARDEQGGEGNVVLRGMP